MRRRDGCTLSLRGVLTIILFVVCVLASLGQVFGAEKNSAKKDKTSPKKAKFPKLACMAYPKEDGNFSYEQLQIFGEEFKVVVSEDETEYKVEYWLVRYAQDGKSGLLKRLRKGKSGLFLRSCSQRDLSQLDKRMLEMSPEHSSAVGKNKRED